MYMRLSTDFEGYVLFAQGLYMHRNGPHPVCSHDATMTTMANNVTDYIFLAQFVRHSLGKVLVLLTD